MSTDHYDVIIIGTGAGGGTLAHRLAPSGKRILLLERGGYLPREGRGNETRRANQRPAPRRPPSIPARLSFQPSRRPSKEH